MILTTTLLRKLKKELRVTNAAFEKHIKDWGCFIDGSCLERARFQERLRTLVLVIQQAGGVVPKEFEQWEEQ